MSKIRNHPAYRPALLALLAAVLAWGVLTGCGQTPHRAQRRVAEARQIVAGMGERFARIAAHPDAVPEIHKEAVAGVSDAERASRKLDGASEQIAGLRPSETGLDKARSMLWAVAVIVAGLLLVLLGVYGYLGLRRAGLIVDPVLNAAKHAAKQLAGGHVEGAAGTLRTIPAADKGFIEVKAKVGASKS